MSNDQTTQRLALLFTPASANAHWVTLDQTGQPPRVIDEIGTPRFELVSLDDAPLAIYRADTAAVYDRLALAALAELVRIVNGEPNVSVDVDEQLRQLRDQLRATVDNAEEMIGSRDSRIDALQHRVECVIGEARRWKQRAEQRKIYIEHYQEEERKLRAEISSLNSGLDVARNAVDRAVNRSNHSNELVDRARAESAALRDQLGNALADYSDIQGQMNTLQAEALQTIIRISGSLPEPVIDADVVVPDFEIDSWFAEDDTPVVEISTSRLSGRMRVNLNEGVIWDGDPESDERPGTWAEPLPHERCPFPHDGTQRSESETISRQLDTIRDQAEKIEELTEWGQKNARHVEILQQTVSETNETLKNTDDMRRRLDTRLGEEREAYEATSAAHLETISRACDAIIAAQHAIFPTASGLSKAQAIGEFRAALLRLPAEVKQTP